VHHVGEGLGELGDGEGRPHGALLTRGRGRPPAARLVGAASAPVGRGAAVKG
jgi:hypothetical protein